MFGVMQFKSRSTFFRSGVLSAMSAMVNLEIPWINVLSKMDLVTSNADEPSGGARNGIRGRKNIARYVRLQSDLRLPFTYVTSVVSPVHVLTQTFDFIFIFESHLFYFYCASEGLNYLTNMLRYLDPDPLLLASARGGEPNPSNPRFHALNQAIVQLVCFFDVCSLYYTFPCFDDRSKIIHSCRSCHWILLIRIRWRPS
jgi:Conserved hypothetical ATP binding protein